MPPRRPTRSGVADRLQPQHGLSARRASTPPQACTTCHVNNVYGARRATASAAIGRTTTAPPTPTTRPPASRPPATRATTTTRPRGVSVQSQPVLPLPDATPTPRAGRATRTTSTRARRATASGAIAPRTTGRPARITGLGISNHVRVVSSGDRYGVEPGPLRPRVIPIASGRHSGRPCSACHLDTNNYKAFTCVTGCHGGLDGQQSSRRQRLPVRVGCLLQLPSTGVRMMKEAHVMRRFVLVGGLLTAGVLAAAPGAHAQSSAPASTTLPRWARVSFFAPGCDHHFGRRRVDHVQRTGDHNRHQSAGRQEDGGFELQDSKAASAPIHPARSAIRGCPSTTPTSHSVWSAATYSCEAGRCG